jgi:hypothetical protein
VRFSRCLGPGLAIAAIAFGAAEAKAQCAGTPPFTCEETLVDGFFSIPFTLPAELDFTAFSSNFDPNDPIPDLENPADVLLVLLDSSATELFRNDDFGQVFPPLGPPFNSQFQAGNVWDAVVQAGVLQAGDYELQVFDALYVFTGGEESFGETFRVSLFAISPE